MSTPGPVDVHVGSRVRLRRTLLGMSQDTLAQALGFTFQQVQKYERGANRMGSSRLMHISQILEVPVAFFFDQMRGAVAEGAGGMSEEGEVYDNSQMLRRETLELVRAYYRIGDANLRAKLHTLLIAIADAQFDDDSK